jgi:transcriptional regulator of acetoin/glycerol metabolism
MGALLEYGWPGNVRELEHAIERAVLLAASETVEVEDLNLRSRGPTPTHSKLEEMTLEQAEKHLIERALAKTQGNVSDAAKLLGLSRSASEIVAVDGPPARQAARP